MWDTADDGEEMPQPMPAPGAGPPSQGIGERGGAGGEKGQSAPEYKSVELVRQNFPEAWIWSQFKTTGYA